LVGILLATTLPAQEVFTGLREEIEAIDAAHPETRLSVCGKILETGERFDYDSARQVSQIGAIRLQLAIEVLRRGAEGKLDLNRLVPASTVNVKSGPGILRLLPSVAMNLRDYTTAMIVQNDALATALLLEQVGLEAVNESARALGLTDTIFELERTPKNGQVNVERWRRVSSARDMVTLLSKIERGEVLDQAGTEALTAMLSHPKPSFLRLAFPRDVTVASITSSGQGSRSEAGFVTIGGKHLVYSVIVQRIRGGADETGEGNSAVNHIARALAARFSRLTQPVVSSSSSLSGSMSASSIGGESSSSSN
jgi:beta-lactamase class A